MYIVEADKNTDAEEVRRADGRDPRVRYCKIHLSLPIFLFCWAVFPPFLRPFTLF